jgi:cobalt-zinc-cadmium efflux system outer membrane protein
VAAKPIVLGEAPAVESLLRAARENNFEFKLRRAEVEQHGYSVQLARHERYPTVQVGPFVSRENAAERETTVGLSLSLPLPVSGRARSAVEAAEVRRRPAEVRRRQAETAMLLAQRELERKVLTAAQALAIKTAEVKRWTPDAMTRFRDAAELADQHYRLGAVPIATYVELQNSYLDAVEALLDTQSEALAAGWKLQELTGLSLEAVEMNP